jgi:pentatricopeptide repeat protein
MLFHFGRDVNITWKHGVNALPKKEQNGQGRISIILWGLTKDVIEEKNSPPLLTNDTRNGFDNRSREDKQKHVEAPKPELLSKEGKVDKAFDLLKDALDSDFKLNENQ